MIKPPIKYIGGKTQILDEILSKFPKEIDNYHELFLGGGSVLLGLLCYINDNKIKIKNNIYAYDINEHIINMYKHIQTNPIQLYTELQILIEDYKLFNNEEYYYMIREKFNNIKDINTIETSAIFIFLNKTCFRGMYRIGPNGFNVPFGNYKNPEIINKEHLLNISKLIQNVIFNVCDFTISIQHIKKNDFVYLDPPYYPETKTSFTKYTKTDFKNHDELFSLCLNMKNKWMMSNSDVEYVKQKFNKYKIIIIVCRRTINSKNPNSKTNELIIQNY